MGSLGCSAHKCIRWQQQGTHMQQQDTCFCVLAPTKFQLLLLRHHRATRQLPTWLYPLVTPHPKGSMAAGGGCVHARQQGLG